MDPIISEVAHRAWLYSEIILDEIIEKDKGEQPLPTEDSRLREFISRFKAGSLFIDLFQERELNLLVENVFRNARIQTFVFDLRWQATIGITEQQMEEVHRNVAYTIAPGFQRPAKVEFNNVERHAVLKAMDEMDFVDHKWKLTHDVILSTLNYMPWLVPLLLISVGEIYGAPADGSN